MGYYTWIEGEAKITGKIIPDTVIEARGWRESDDDGYFWIETLGEDDDVQLVNGKLEIVEGDKYQIVHYRYEESVKAYGFEESASILAEEVKHQGGEIHGMFVGKGEDQGDIWRVKFDGKSWAHETPTLTWPDGTTGMP